jgi:RHS repeat-associated protein
VYFYGVDGQQLGAYPLNSGASAIEIATYFGSKRLGFNTNPNNGSETATAPDRLGSYGQYYPWGESKSGNNPADIWSYATYWRDSFTGLDYARHRYYSNVNGRFMTPDSYRGSATLNNPQSWNRYAYTRGDPVNRADPSGRDDCDVSSSDFCITTVEDLGDDDDGGDDGGGGDTAGGYVDVQPNVPASNPYTQNQMQDLTQGLNDAVQRLIYGSTNCAGALSGFDGLLSVATAVTTLEATLYMLEPLQAGTGAQTNGSESVFINVNGAFFNTAPNANGTVTVLMPNKQGVQSAFTFASLSDLQGFILLHELGHQLGTFGPDINAAANGQNSASVLDNCFTQGANGVLQ